MEFQIAPLLGDDYARNLYAGIPRPVLPLFKVYLSRVTSLLDSHSYDLLWIEKEIFP
jgi:hypothetical protein